MTKKCSTCEDIREYAPDFATNGVTDAVCTYLQNNTGISPTGGHTDFGDLNDVNDCLIRGLLKELGAYEVCDWQEFMDKFGTNLWTVLKAMVCAIGGIWTNINSLRKRTDELCALLNQAIAPSINRYGIMPLSGREDNNLGTQTEHVTKLADDGSLSPYTKAVQCMGIFYASMTRESCEDGREEMLEWIGPGIYLYYLNANTVNGDILWKIKKSDAQSKIGISDHLWTIFTESSWTWGENLLSPSRQVARLRISVGTEGLAADEMGITFLGCDAPNEAISEQQIIGPMDQGLCRCYRHYI